MSYTKIINTVNNAVQNLPNAPSNLFVENIQGKPVDVLTPWMRTTLLPSEPVQVTIGYERQLRYTSLIQLDYFQPLNVGSTSDFIDSTVDWFNNKDNRFMENDGFNFTVLSAWRQTSEPTDKWYRTPIMIRVQWYA